MEHEDPEKRIAELETSASRRQGPPARKGSACDPATVVTQAAPYQADQPYQAEQHFTGQARQVLRCANGLPVRTPSLSTRGRVGQRRCEKSECRPVGLQGPRVAQASRGAHARPRSTAGLPQEQYKVALSRARWSARRRDDQNRGARSSINHCDPTFSGFPSPHGPPSPGSDRVGPWGPKPGFSAPTR